jgi:hypothetical protein
MKTTREVTTATTEVMIATTARGVEVMKREDITIQVITMAVMGRKVITLLAITTMTIRATKGRMDTTVTTVTNPKVVAMVVPLADPATVTVVEMAVAAVVVTEVADMAVAMAAAAVVVNITKVEPGTCCYVILPCLRF